MLVKENFIAVAVPTDACRNAGPEGEFLRGAGIDKHWVTSSGYFSCVSASGKWLGGEASAKVLEEFQKLPENERKPGAVAIRELESVEQLIPAPPEEGLVLRVHGRFLARDDEGQLRHVQEGDFPLLEDWKYWSFLFEPNTEYMWMTKEEWRSLVPAEPVRGEQSEVSHAIAERLARFHLSPRRALTSEDGIVATKEIKSAKLTVTVESVTPQRIQLRLGGWIHHGSDYDAAKATSPNGPLGFGFESPIHGVLEYDRRNEAFIRFDIVAPGEVWGRWGDANSKSQGVERPGRTPIGFAFDLAKGDSPSNRLPPAGNGSRALRAGYFATGKRVTE